MKEQPRLLDRVKEEIRIRHDSIRTEEAYIKWIKHFIHFHKLRHPKDMGAAEIQSFLSYLAIERNVVASTQNQALCALVFLYRKVLNLDFEKPGVKIQKIQGHPPIDTNYSSSWYFHYAPFMELNPGGQNDPSPPRTGLTEDYALLPLRVPLCTASVSVWCRCPFGTQFRASQAVDRRSAHTFICDLRN